MRTSGRSFVSSESSNMQAVHYCVDPIVDQCHDKLLSCLQEEKKQIVRIDQNLIVVM